MNEYHINLCRLITQNFDYFEYVCGPYREIGFQQHIIDMAYKCTFTLWKKEFPKAKEADLNLVHTFISSGCAAIIVSWVQEGMQRSPEELDRFCEKASRRTLSLLNDTLE